MHTYATEEDVIEAGERFDRARYWRTVRELAEEALDLHPDDEDAQYESIDESVDGNHYIIYTRQNLDVLRFTENDEAYEDLGELPSSEGAYRIYSYLAFCAMRADVLDELARAREERDESES